MQGYFIVYDGVYEIETGISKKIKSQIQTFNNAGLNCIPYHMHNRKAICSKLIYRLPFFNVSPYWKISDELLKADFIYLRRPMATSYYMCEFFEKIKQANPKCKIVLELPTYPYDAELSSRVVDLPFLWQDRFFRIKLYKWVDRVAVLGDETEIWRIPTLKIYNGIDVNGSDIRNINNALFKDINLIAVGMLKNWHGYERIIQGLANYYKDKPERKIYLHIVGEGSELQHYKDLVAQKGLESVVKFYGFLQGEKLAAIYDKCDIGVVSLGLYKKNINMSCDLKSREYLLKGLPIITGSLVDVIEEYHFSQYLQFSNSPEPLDCERIIKFYDEVYKKGKSLVANEIHAFAMKYLSMDNAMKNVIDYLKK